MYGVGLGHARIAARDTKKTFCQLVRIKPQGEFSQKVAECLFRITAGSCVFREGAAWGRGYGRHVRNLIAYGSRGTVGT